MTDTVRCPSCRGAKKVPKLGGMIGECNTCVGKGTILAIDKPKSFVMTAIEPVSISEIVSQTANAVPASTIEPDVKIDGKKAIFKRKK